MYRNIQLRCMLSFFIAQKEKNFFATRPEKNVVAKIMHLTVRYAELELLHLARGHLT